MEKGKRKQTLLARFRPTRNNLGLKELTRFRVDQKESMKDFKILVFLNDCTAILLLDEVHALKFQDMLLNLFEFFFLLERCLSLSSHG
jgi:hypothetical protein